MTRAALLALALAAPLLVQAQGAPTNYPAGTALPTCTADRQAGWSDGYNAGVSQGDGIGFNRGFPEGFTVGAQQVLSTCQSDPSQCGITLTSCLPTPQYGETEPNDNMVTADAMIDSVSFWGQSYGPSDQDWYYVVTSAANQNLIVNFTVPTGSTAGWKVEVRDAVGNLLADFDTSVAGGVPAPAGSVAYRVTLGFVGTYYVVVKPAGRNQNFAPYYLSTVLQYSPLDTANFIAGFYDAEVEPNDTPSTGGNNHLASGVTMYGMINLQFKTPVPSVGDATTYEWGQGEADWFYYHSPGNEIITLTFCAREQCAQGNWFVDVYDHANATLLEGGAPASAVKALVAFNTNNDGAEPESVRFGVANAGHYFIRVNHKRLLSAPCSGFQTDLDNNGVVGPNPQACGCAEGGYSCDIDILNPGNPIVTVTNEYPPCPGSGNTTQTCPVSCVCAGSGLVGAPAAGCLTSGRDPVACSCPFGLLSCDITIDNPKPPVATTTSQYPLCPDGTGGGNEPQCTVGCLCTSFGGVVEVPEDALTSQYNFTWFGTALPPSTINSDAYQDYQSRPNPYR